MKLHSLAARSTDIPTDFEVLCLFSSVHTDILRLFFKQPLLVSVPVPQQNQNMWDLKQRIVKIGIVTIQIGDDTLNENRHIAFPVKGITVVVVVVLVVIYD